MRELKKFGIEVNAKMKEMLIQGNCELIRILTMMIADYDQNKGDMTMDRVLELPLVV